VRSVWHRFQAGESHLEPLLSVVLSLANWSRVWAHSLPEPLSDSIALQS